SGDDAQDSERIVDTRRDRDDLIDARFTKNLPHLILRAQEDHARAMQAKPTGGAHQHADTQRADELDTRQIDERGTPVNHGMAGQLELDLLHTLNIQPSRQRDMRHVILAWHNLQGGHEFPRTEVIALYRSTVTRNCDSSLGDRGRMSMATNGIRT